jgi:Zn-dependent oligopeptidase
MAMVGNAGFTTFLSRETMFMALGFERSEIMDKVIAGHAEDMKQRNDEIAKLNRVLQSVRADSAKGKGFKMDPSGPELQELQRQGVPLPKDPQKKLDGINADLKAIEDKYGLKLDPNHPQYGKMLQTLAGKARVCGRW